MHKRVVDGDALWRSEKIAHIEPVWARAEFANLIPLALANGVFEASPERIWADVYSFNRPDRQLSHVVEILAAFERVKLLFRWTDEQGKVWGYWVGIEKPGRLPGKSRRGRNEAVGPEPPAEHLRTFLRARLDSIGIQKLPGFGSGSCSGNGSGHGVGKEGAPEDGAPVAQDKPRPSPFAFAGCHLSVTQKQDRLLGEAFPWVDRSAEFRKIDSWLETNSGRRPKQAGRFLHNWFSKIEAPSNGAKGDTRAEQRTRSNLRAAGFVA